MMKKIVLILGIVLIMAGCQSTSNESDKLTVAVSIVPQETFVKAVAGDLVDVVVMIPPGASPTNYQPTPQQIEELSRASIYLGIDVPTEQVNILPSLSSINDQMKVIDLAESVDEVYPARFFEDEDHEDEGHEVEDNDEHEDEEHEDEDHDEQEEDGHEDHVHEGRDPHIWMSPKRVIVMIESIQEVLSSEDPDNSETYRENAEAYIKELELLNDRFEEGLSQLDNREFVVMHPSVGYLADDYKLEMIAIEKDGKEATVSHMKEVIDFCIEHGIEVVFYQSEFDDNQAKTIASEIGGRVQSFEPLASNYIEMMDELLDTFKKTLAE